MKEKPKKVVLIINNKKKEAIEIGLGINNELSKQGIFTYTMYPEYISKNGGICVPYEEILKNIEVPELAISVGGDGTLIYTSRLFSCLDVPIIGVNVGKLGFLTYYDQQNFGELLKDFISFDPELWSKKYEMDERILLEAEIVEGLSFRKAIIVNELVVRRMAPRMLIVEVFVNGEFLSEFVGDGILVSTPTGSTAYSLAAGGPILQPHIEAYILTPLCPHSLSVRPVVLDNIDKVQIKIVNPQPDIIVSIDGQETTPLTGESIIKIQTSKYKLKLIKPKNVSFFYILREKLGWRGGIIKY